MDPNFPTSLSWLSAFVDLLKTGGPWTLLAIGIIFYLRKERELRQTYLKLIDMATLQAGVLAKTEMTISSLRETLVTALERRD